MPFNFEKPTDKLSMEVHFKHEDITFACFFTELLRNKEIKIMVEQKKRRNQQLK